ncbi:MAG: hypothetical protein J6R59_10010 [Paludibacteraceae bacterium]|nr:hypothetical protein [Paludibacteraceae bacterium]
MRVEIVDEDHIWVNNRQFISLKRFGEAKKDVANEIKLLADKNKELAEENEALKVLLKNQLNEVVDSHLTEALANKICVEESDHEWECCGVSTGESHYRCKKCGAYKTYPIEAIYR